MYHTVFLSPQKQRLRAKTGETLSEVFAQNGIVLSADCGGKGVCGKCKVKVLQGKVNNAEPDEEGWVLACRAQLCENVTIELPSRSLLATFIEHNEENAATNTKNGHIKNKKLFGVALDIGTTTLEAELIDLTTGETLQKHVCFNPQIAYGADVISRIQACREGKFSQLRACLLRQIDAAVAALLKDQNGGDKEKSVQTMTVAGNTAMLHIALGYSPETLGVAPFTPLFTAAQTLDKAALKGTALDVKTRQAYVLPSASAFIGADVVAGVVECGMSHTDETQILIDLGTNGEIVLSHQGKLYAASAAAGPALEGACIECGLGGVTGAIDQVYMQNGKLSFSTVGGAEGTGLCGSGLIDLIALLRCEGLLDENGTWREETETPLSERLCGDRFYLTEKVYVSQADVRQFQLAKGAIRAGIETLLSVCNVSETQIQSVYIAGRLGGHIDVKNALLTGLLPPSWSAKIKAVGNTALSGARRCLQDKTARENLQETARRIQTVQLPDQPSFTQAFLRHMSFVKF